MMSNKFFIASLLLIGILSICFTGIVKGDTVVSNVPIKINFPVQALTSSPTDSQTVYFGILPKAPSTTAGVSKQEINVNGNITGAYIYCYSGTAGTNENWVMYVRVNNLVDYAIATVGSATNERIWEKWNFNIPVVKGDYFEIKGVQPLWATNPLTTIYGGYIEVTNISSQETEVVVETSTGVFSINEIGIILTLIFFIIALFLKEKEIWTPILLFIDVPVSLATGIFYFSGAVMFSISWWVGICLFVFAILLSFGGLYYGLNFGRK